MWWSTIADGRRVWSGTLCTDQAEVTEVLNALLGAGVSFRQLGLKAPPGHEVTAAEVARVDRGVIRFATA